MKIAEFAEYCGVSSQAISNAIRRKRVVLENGDISLKNKKNKEYIKNRAKKKSKEKKPAKESSVEEFSFLTELTKEMGEIVTENESQHSEEKDILRRKELAIEAKREQVRLTRARRISQEIKNKQTESELIHFKVVSESVMTFLSRWLTRTVLNLRQEMPELRTKIINGMSESDFVSQVEKIVTELNADVWEEVTKILKEKSK